MSAEHDYKPLRNKNRAQGIEEREAVRTIAIGGHTKVSRWNTISDHELKRSSGLTSLAKNCVENDTCWQRWCPA